MRVRQVAAVVGTAGAVWVGLNAAVTFGAAHPIGQGKVLGTARVIRRSPEQFGLAYKEITYAPRRDAWWITAGLERPSVVLVHGYDPFIDPKSGDPGPLLELAAAFHSWGFNALVINLGYVTGAHPFSGGQLEAGDVTAAAKWCHAHAGGPVALWGFSAGGSAALLAASDGAPVAAVAADSAFADAGTVIVHQASKATHLPAPLFRFVPYFMSMMASSGPANLTVILPKHPITVPVLLVQGTADTAIPPENLDILRRLTGGTAWGVRGADHIKSYETDPNDYLTRARLFLDAHLLPPNR